MRCLFILIILAANVFATAGLRPNPFENKSWSIATNAVDHFIFARLANEKIEPANQVSDLVFVRRVYLDLIGEIPPVPVLIDFVRDTSPDKRAKLIDKLMQREEFTDYWSMKWADVLRVKSEFPINLWPNAVQAYYHWINAAVKENMPYDQFAKALLTSSGSNFRVAPVNFYRAVQARTPEGIASAVALTFMGVRFEKLSLAEQKHLITFFSRVEFKSTAEWKEQIVCLNPAPTNVLHAALPDGQEVKINTLTDPRLVFADWLLQKDNKYFARAHVNRVWFWLFGRGLIDEADDIRPDNPASHPALLAYLEKYFVESGYDSQALMRLILNSRTYQQSAVAHGQNINRPELFASYPVRRLDAEIVVEAFNQLFNMPGSYSSPIPEPFTFIPADQSTIKLADGSITSPELEMFGRPARDTGLLSERNNAANSSQKLYTLNSSILQQKIQKSKKMRFLLRKKQNIVPLYMTFLSRRPTITEIKLIEKYNKTAKLSRNQKCNDLVWTLINSKEFLYRH